MNRQDKAAVAAAAAAGMSAAWQAGLDAVVADANAAIRDTVTRKGGLAAGPLSGFVAEQWHAGTFNVDAYKKGVTEILARVPESTLEGAPDIEIMKGGAAILEVQSKYLRTAARTASKLWKAKYDGVDVKLVPEDQLQGVIDSSARKAAATAPSDASRAASARHTVDHAADRVRAEGAESRPLTRDGAHEVTDRVRRGEHALHMKDVLSPGEIAEKAAEAGAVAAGIGFAMGAAPKLLEAVQHWREHRSLSDEDFQALLADAGRDGGRSALWAGLQGAISSTLIHLAATGALGEIVGALGPGPMGAISVCVVQALRDGIALWRSEIDGEEFARRCVITGVVAAAGVAGGAIGQALIPVPVLGALIGSTVGSLIGRLGVSAAAWAAERLRPYVEAATSAIGNVLFGWDALVRTRARSAEVEALLASVANSQRGEPFQAFAMLQFPPIDSRNLQNTTDAQTARLDDLERRARDP